MIECHPIEFNCKTSLQKKVLEYMNIGGKLNSLGMFLLKEEVPQIGNNPYIQNTHVDEFHEYIDKHLQINNISFKRV